MNFFEKLKFKLNTLVDKVSAFFFVKKSEFSNSMQSTKYDLKGKYEDTKVEVMNKVDSAKEVASDKADEVSARFKKAKEAFLAEPEKEECPYCALGNCSKHTFNKKF